MARFDINFFSQSLNRAVRISALMPTDQGPYMEKTEKTPFPTLYLLHGMTGSRDNWVETEALWKTADQYHIAIILPSGWLIKADICNLLRCLPAFREW